MRTARALTVSRGGGTCLVPGGCTCLSRRGVGVPAWSRGGGYTCLVRGGTCLVRGGVPAWSGGVPAWSWGVPAWPGGVPAWSRGGTCLALGGTCLVLGGYLPGPRGGVPAWSGEVPAWPWGGVPAWSGGGYLPGPGGVCTWSGTPPLWTEFLTHASENITLPQTSFAGGNETGNLDLHGRQGIPFQTNFYYKLLKYVMYHYSLFQDATGTIVRRWLSMQTNAGIK